MGLYNEYEERVKNGEVFTKKDLTEDRLYQMSVVEGNPDGVIGSLFQMSKGQIKYLRSKNNLSNVFLKKRIEEIEKWPQCFPDDEDISEVEIYMDFVISIKSYCEMHKPKWKFENALSYFKEKSETLPVLKQALIELGYELDKPYKVTFKNLEHLGSHQSKKRATSGGKKVNQRKNNEAKIKSGDLGEQIAYDAEVDRLTDLGLEDLIDEIKIIPKKDKEGYSIDGKGYDIISFNEKREKIYIEVKCSLTNKSNRINFFISNKEVKFINGELDEIDKEHAFIYYVYNINKKDFTADIFAITNKMFNEYELHSEVYSINEDFTEIK